MDSESDETPKFALDEVETELPKELLELWGRASFGTQRVEVRRLLESRARVKGIPAQAQENQLVVEYKKKADTFLKIAQQQVLNILRVGSYRWIKGLDPGVELQLY